MKSKFKSAKSFEERTKDAAQIKHEERDFIFSFYTKQNIFLM